MRHRDRIVKGISFEKINRNEFNGFNGFSLSYVYILANMRKYIYRVEKTH